MQNAAGTLVCRAIDLRGYGPIKRAKACFPKGTLRVGHTYERRSRSVLNENKNRNTDQRI